MSFLINLKHKQFMKKIDQKMSVSCPRRCPGSDEWDYLWWKCDYHIAMRRHCCAPLIHHLSALTNWHLKSSQHTHMQTKHIVCYHLRDDQLIISTWRWSASPRGKGCGGLWSGESSANQHRGAVRTEVFYCTLRMLPSCLGGSGGHPNGSFFLTLPSRVKLETCILYPGLQGPDKKGVGWLSCTRRDGCEDTTCHRGGAQIMTGMTRSNYWHSW